MFLSINKTVLMAILIINAVVFHPLDGAYKKIVSMKEINSSESEGVLYLFDLDDTLFDSPYMLGSKAWRSYIKEATKHFKRNWHDILTLYLTKNVPVELVESYNLLFIHDLQQQGHLVCGFTAREREKWYDIEYKGVDLLTLQQVTSLNIKLDHERFKQLYPRLAAAPEYFEGIFFADTELKGDYLRKLFSDGTYPKKIIFIDDKLSQIESVDLLLSELDIEHECYWYCAIEDKTMAFDPLISNIQLYYLIKSRGKWMLSDAEAKKIAICHPNLGANFYLSQIIKLF